MIRVWPHVDWKLECLLREIDCLEVERLFVEEGEREFRAKTEQ